MGKLKYIFLAFVIALAFILAISLTKPKEQFIAERESKIPADAIKMTPGLDTYPPVLHSDEFEKPVPLATINSAGAEDSPFIPADRDEIYFFFTPDVRVPVEKQILDEVTGIYVSKYENGIYQKPERVMLQKQGKLALDGCEFVSGNTMLFCSVREGYTGINWFSAEYKNEKWNFLKLVDFPEEYKVGELHEHENQLYYHSDREGGKGGLDIWMIERLEDRSWTSPVNVEAVNSEENEGWPYITNDGSEMWINRGHQGSPSVFRSKKINGEWQTPELIVSQFAGEPTLDKYGNLYFVHHYYTNGTMIEADIYVAYKK